jgi:hypothetical protein
MSNLINRTGLQKFATKLWAKIKDRYDNAFVDAEIPAEEKKIKFTKAGGGATKDVSLEDYARLQDRNEFKQDVSADNVAIINNSHIGNTKGFDSRNRGLGFRQLTTSAFVDGYVDHIRVYLEASATGNATFKVWAITKGTNGKESDRVKKVVWDSKVLEVNSITENSVERKFVIIPIKDSFADETYFIARCSTHNVEVAQNIKAEYTNDVVNLNNTQPPDTEGSEITWAGINATGNTAIMYLYGRESIGSLALKLRQTQADGSNYVLKSETTTTSAPNKVVKLDEHGKLNKDMLPSIAVNDYFSVTDFTDEKLGALTYENGDVVVVENGGVVSKKYLCIHKGTTNSTNEFVELNSKDGVVQSVNGKVGAVELQLQATSDKVKLNITSAGSTATTEVDIISDTEITAILDALQ